MKNPTLHINEKKQNFEASINHLKAIFLHTLLNISFNQYWQRKRIKYQGQKQAKIFLRVYYKRRD